MNITQLKKNHIVCHFLFKIIGKVNNERIIKKCKRKISF